MGAKMVIYLELSAQQGQLEPPPALLELARTIQNHPACTQVFLLKSQEQAGLFLLESFWSVTPTWLDYAALEGVLVGWKLRRWNFERLALEG
jgi:hypothetical protein